MTTMNAVKMKNDLPTGVTQQQVKDFINECGSEYSHFGNEQYPIKHGAGMRERIIAIHNEAKVFYSQNVELGRVFAYSQEEANKEFASRNKRLHE